MEPQAYEAWLAGGSGGPAVPPAQAGEKLFTGPNYACATCHKADGKGPAPRLAGVYGSQVELADGRKVLADDNYIRESIMVPSAKVVKGFQPIMPPFQGVIAEEQVIQLIAYIKSLKADGQGQ
jgi:cytochrome c oxidase subunit 2